MEQHILTALPEHALIEAPIHAPAFTYRSDINVSSATQTG